MESISNFVIETLPSSNTETLSRREAFTRYIVSALGNPLPVTYNFKKVIGDGSCFFHAIMRYFGYLVWHDLPNKDTSEMNEEEQVTYLQTLSQLRETATEHIREFTGDPEFVLDPNVPEYHLICNFIANSSDLRIIVLEYDSYGDERLNVISEFSPEGKEHSDTIILLNYSHHFTLIFPTSTDSKFDNKTIRSLVGDQILTNSQNSGKRF